MCNFLGHPVHKIYLVLELNEDVIIKGTKLQLDDWEYVTSMRHLYLSSEGMHAGQRAFLVLGTNFNYGEDITSRGHIKVNICSVGRNYPI